MKFDEEAAYRNICKFYKSRDIGTDQQHINVPLSIFMFKGYKVEVQELFDMDLIDFVNKHLRGAVSFDIIQRFAHDALLALSCLDELSICHGDVKYENFLVKFERGDSDRFQLKLTDFGFATMTRDSIQGRRYTPFGTKKYIAPEIAASQPFDNSADMWSLGIIINDLVSSTRLPFTRPQYVESIRLVASLLQKNSAQRVSVYEALQSRFFKLSDDKIETEEEDEDEHAENALI